MELQRASALAVVAAIGLGVQALPAAAHDPAADDYQPYYPSGFFVYDWTGFYAGANLGGAASEAESVETLFPGDPVNVLGLTYGQSQTSVTGGAQLGWQKQWGAKLVTGIEAGFSLIQFDNIKFSPLSGDFTDLVPDLSRSVSVNDIFTLTGRVGYTDGRWLAYFKGGVANAGVDVSYHNLNTGESTSNDGRETGWTAGVGIDYALTPSIYLGIEYNYLHFRNDASPPLITEAPTHFSDINIELQNVVVRLNYRFNVPCCQGPRGP
jgi:opacity protein-like surface antigen